jgi:site-specific DNA-cytosine methylase
MAIPVLSFFTGGGFLDLGFKQAGFPIPWTNENCAAFITLYEHGMSSWLSSINGKTVTARIANAESICDLSARSVLKEAFEGSRPSEFGVIGGPPCPDFSNGGTHAGGNGSNGQLTSVFVDMICQLRPSFFVIENVAGLYRCHKHRAFLNRKISQLRERGYAVDFNLLNALELGVPQNRERDCLSSDSKNPSLNEPLAVSLPPMGLGGFLGLHSAPTPMQSLSHGRSFHRSGRSRNSLIIFRSNFRFIRRFLVTVTRRRLRMGWSSSKRTPANSSFSSTADRSFCPLCACK